MSHFRMHGVWVFIGMVLMGMLWSAPGRSELLEAPVELVTEYPEHVFVPPGFDSNDNSQVVLSGHYLNSCYKVGPASAEVDLLRHQIRVHAQSYWMRSSWCLQVLVPYTVSVQLGVLPVGEYQVIYEQQGGQVSSAGILSIAVHRGSDSAPVDDAIYAIMDSVDYRQGVLQLNGRLPGECTTLKEVRILTRSSNIVEVLPIVQVQPDFETGQECGLERRQFQHRVKLDLPWHGATLIHVRSLNGQALNKVVEAE